MAAGKVKGTPGTQPGTNLNIVTGVNEGPRSEESGLKRLAQENTGCRFFSFFSFLSPRPVASVDGFFSKFLAGLAMTD